MRVDKAVAHVAPGFLARDDPHLMKGRTGTSDVGDVTMRSGPRTGFTWTPETIIYAITLWHRKHRRARYTRDWEAAGENHR